MAVNVQKLLPSSKNVSLAKVASSIAKPSSTSGVNEETQSSVGIIRVKVIELDKILKGTLALDKKKLDDEKRKESSKRKEKIEEKLETKPQAEKGLIKMPRLPKLGIFDWIKNFIGNIILGYFAVRLVDHLPKIIPIVKFIGKATDFFLGVGGNLLNGLITFVDSGYKAYDFTRNQLKNFGGENAVAVFDKFTGAIDGVVTAALAASLALVNMSGGDGGGPSAGVRQKPKVTTSGGIDLRSPFRQRPKVTIGGGNKALLSSVRPFTKRLPIIGAILDFGLSVAMGEDPGRAAFKSIGAGLLGSIGAALGGPFAILTGIAGSMLGDWAGGALYDLFFRGKRSSNNGLAKAAGGGQPVTRGGRVASGPRRAIKKTQTKRQISIQPTQLKPGANVGGEDKVEKVFPKSDDNTKVSPLDYVESSYKTISEEPFFGPLMSISTKALVGQKPSKVDYKNAAQGLSNWMNMTFSDEVLRTGSLYAAGGGEINAEMLSKKSGDMTDAIAKSLEENISKRVDESIDELMKQMMLKPQTKPANVPGPTEPGPEDTIDIQGGSVDFWTLVAVASREDGDPQAWADVAQSVYNRLASGAYSGKTIKDLILGQMQYEPTWRYPNGPTRGIGKPNPEWYQIKDATSAGVAAGQSADAMKKVAAALLDPTLHKNAREFILGITDFRGYSVSGGVQRKSGDNYFGWYNNYTANKIGSVPNFGATSTVIAGAGPGMVGPLGAGRVGAVDQFNTIAKKFGLQLTSDYRPGDPGYHGKNRARDYSNDTVGRGTPQQLAFAKYLAENYGSSITQLIYTPLGFGIANGKKVGLDYWGSSTNAQHYHHVHVALFHGGLAKKDGLHMLHEGEFVIDKDSVNTFGKDFIALINETENKTQLKKKADALISILQNYTDYERPEPEVVMMPVPTPVPVSIGDGYSDSSGGIAMFAGEDSDPFKVLYQGT